jgi:hypothetical protein
MTASVRRPRRLRLLNTKPISFPPRCCRPVPVRRPGAPANRPERPGGVDFPAVSVRRLRLAGAGAQPQTCYRGRVRLASAVRTRGRRAADMYWNACHGWFEVRRRERGYPELDEVDDVLAAAARLRQIPSRRRPRRRKCSRPACRPPVALRRRPRVDRPQGAVWPQCLPLWSGTVGGRPRGSDHRPHPRLT